MTTAPPKVPLVSCELADFQFGQRELREANMKSQAHVFRFLFVEKKVFPFRHPSFC